MKTSVAIPFYVCRSLVEEFCDCLLLSQTFRLFCRSDPVTMHRSPGLSFSAMNMPPHQRVRRTLEDKKTSEAAVGDVRPNLIHPGSLARPHGEHDQT